jgi:SRSO17 transposase
MDTTTETGWQAEFEAWLAPFLDRLGRKEQRRWAPIYLRGLLGPGGRKSVEPMAARVAPGDVQQLHHFVAASPWATAPLEAELVRRADRLVGGPEAVLVIDDTALVKQGQQSVGVARQYCGELGKRANCQALVSLTLARAEVPVGVGLRLFLPEGWAADRERRTKAGVPAEVTGAPKWRIALDELDRVRTAGARFGGVVADAEYGKAAGFRAGLSERGLLWAVGILPTQRVYPAEVTVAPAVPRPTGRPPKHPLPSAGSRSVVDAIEALPEPAFRELSWRRGTKGALRAEFAAVRVRVAEGPPMRDGRHLPGGAAWLVCERRSGGERKYYLTNHPADAPLEVLAALIKARWVCEQAHRQLKGELGLDHFEGRSWLGLHHHALLTLIAFCFLQHLRLRGKNPRRAGWATARALAPCRPAAAARRGDPGPVALPALPATPRLRSAPVNVAQ